MQTASAQPAEVLDYATKKPQDGVVRRFRATATLLLCMLIGGAGGWIINPRMYRAVGYIQIAQSQGERIGNLELGAAGRQTQQDDFAAGIKAPGNLSAAAAKLPTTVNLTTTEIAAHLKVQPLPQTWLVSVSYDNPDSVTAAAVVNAIMGIPTTSGMIVAPATPPASPRQNSLYTVGGLAIGLLIGVAIIARRSK